MKQKRIHKSLISVRNSSVTTVLTGVLLILGSMFLMLAVLLLTHSVSAADNVIMQYTGIDSEKESIYDLSFLSSENGKDPVKIVNKMYLDVSGEDMTFVISGDSIISTRYTNGGSIGLGTSVGSVATRFSNILGGNLYTILSDNITILGGERTSIKEGNNNATVLGTYAGNSLKGNNTVPVVFVGGQENEIGGNGGVLLGGKNNKISDNVTNGEIYGGENNQIYNNLQGVTIVGSNVKVNTVDNVFVFNNSGTFIPSSGNAFYINSLQGVGLNGDAVGNRLLSSGAVNFGLVNQHQNCNGDGKIGYDEKGCMFGCINGVWIAMNLTCVNEDNSKGETGSFVGDCTNIPNNAEFCDGLDPTKYTSVHFESILVEKCPESTINQCTFRCKNGYSLYSDGKCHKDCQNTSHGYLKHGESAIFYATEVCPTESCREQVRTCRNGELDGNNDIYRNGGCVVSAKHVSGDVACASGYICEQFTGYTVENKKCSVYHRFNKIGCDTGFHPKGGNKWTTGVECEQNCAAETCDGYSLLGQPNEGEYESCTKQNETCTDGKNTVYRCKEPYYYDAKSNTCVIPTYSCLGEIPANAERNNYSMPTKDTEYFYSEGNEACSYKCVKGSVWSGNRCKMITYSCLGEIPANAERNNNLMPSGDTGYFYSEGNEACSYRCISGFVWDGMGCVGSDCSSPCGGIANGSIKICYKSSSVTCPNTCSSASILYACRNGVLDKSYDSSYKSPNCTANGVSPIDYNLDACPFGCNCDSVTKYDTGTCAINTVFKFINAQSGYYMSGNSCPACSAGTYTSSDNRFGYCASCPAGTYNPVTGSNSCLNCPTGQYSELGASFCSDICTSSAPWCNFGTPSNEATYKTTYTCSQGTTVCTCPSDTYWNGSNCVEKPYLCGNIHYSCINGGTPSKTSSTESEYSWECSLGSITGYCTEPISTLSCYSPCGTIANGESKTCFKTTSVSCPDTCSSIKYSCNNGILSSDYNNSYTEISCSRNGVSPDDYNLDACPSGCDCEPTITYSTGTCATNTKFRVTNAQKGYYMDGDACVACPAGTYTSSLNKSTSCIPCPDGQYSEVGSTSCTTVCPTGKQNEATCNMGGTPINKDGQTWKDNFNYQCKIDNAHIFQCNVNCPSNTFWNGESCRAISASCGTEHNKCVTSISDSGSEDTYGYYRNCMDGNGTILVSCKECKTGSHPNGNKCEKNSCQGTLPANTESNTTTPSNNTTNWEYKDNPTSACTYKCKAGYTYNESTKKCEEQLNGCLGSYPDNSERSGKTPSSNINWYYDDKLSSACTYRCTNGYKYDSSRQRCMKVGDGHVTVTDGDENGNGNGNGNRNSNGNGNGNVNEKGNQGVDCSVDIYHPDCLSGLNFSGFNFSGLDLSGYNCYAMENHCVYQMLCASPNTVGGNNANYSEEWESDDSIDYSSYGDIELINICLPNCKPAVELQPRVDRIKKEYEEGKGWTCGGASPA